ncbi:plasmid-related protein [Pandoraea morbifera]|uniref:Plasmid-related protein n=1 Tax=Pandoraea morbifera TaxID=2508300 RepID=A0A5E4U7E0_9BURK|nr:hypothetical protein [Pandoraea morbifera]VVD95402.1 plasmid-related protein [Pandoraea morbifera]
MATTSSTLTEKYSVLLTLSQLAAILDRSPEGLRISLSRSSSDWATKINATKVCIGRRVYFRTEAIAALIDEEFSLFKTVA